MYSTLSLMLHYRGWQDPNAAISGSCTIVLTLPDETDVIAEVGGRRLQPAASHHIAVEITGGGVTMDRVQWRHPNGSTSPSDVIALDCRTARACPPMLQALIPVSVAAEPSGGRHQPGPSHRCGSHASFSSPLPNCSHYFLGKSSLKLGPITLCPPRHYLVLITLSRSILGDDNML